MSRRSRSLATFGLAIALATSGVAQHPTATADPWSNAGDAIRVGLRARAGSAARLTPLSYLGGFETKTLLFETLVRRDDDGRIVGALAKNWTFEEDGSIVFELRPDATWHDGSRVTAEQVCAHFRRWIGHEEHDWLASNRVLTGAEVLSDAAFRLTVAKPWAVLEDLVAINPCAILGPTSNDWEGTLRRPIGTGAFEFVAARADGSRWLLAKRSGEGPRIDVSFYPRGRDATPLHDLILGRIDLFVGGWDEDLPAEQLAAFEQDDDFTLTTAPGSSLCYLSFRLDDGPTADLDVRRRITEAIDRDEVVRVVEGGRADPCATWAAPSVAFWPAGPAAERLRTRTPHQVAAAGDGETIRVAPGKTDSRCARTAIEVVAQLRRAGFDAIYVAGPPSLPESARIVLDATSNVTPETTEAGTFRKTQGRALRERTQHADVFVQTTYGMPYCPHQSLVSRFGLDRRAGDVPRGSTQDLTDLVAQAASIPSEEERIAVYRAIQELMDTQYLIVPLHVPWRVAVHRSDIEGLRLPPDVYHVDLTRLRRATDVDARDASFTAR
jgi:ABC-type transport system substrate-binding protein